MTIRYIKGDATRPFIEDGDRYICHICNNVGKWGAGFVLSVNNRWMKPKLEYQKSHYAENRLWLGWRKLGSY